ncbi:MAG: hypothetical protein WBR18_14760 [Anaerolineales bacterium]
MEDPPPFFRDDFQPNSLQMVQTPASTPRRGEWIAWLCTLGAILGSGLWAARSGELPAIGVGLSVFFGLAACLISFGNWVDRNTQIQWTPERVDYHSPLRTISLRWREIDALWAVRTSRSWRVGVGGGDRAFAFRTGGAMRFGSSGEMRVGFPQGDSLAAFIKRQADLGPPRWSDGRWMCEQKGVAAAPTGTSGINSDGE